MKRSCDACQIPYEARRASSRFCSARCRQRAQRSPVAAFMAAPVPGDGHLTDTTLAELETADMVISSLGQAALLLARRLGAPSFDTGSSISALVREHRATLTAAVGQAHEHRTP